MQFGSPEAVKLREEANKYFGRKEYPKALEAYDRALKATPEDGTTEDRALLHSNKAACHMMQQKCVPLLPLQPAAAFSFGMPATPASSVSYRQWSSHLVAVSAASQELFAKAC